MIAHGPELVQRFGSINGLKAAWLGGGEDAAYELLKDGAAAGMEIVLSRPAAAHLDEHMLLGAEVTARLHGGSVDIARDDAAAIRGADVVYAPAHALAPELARLASPDALFFETAEDDW